MKYITSLVAQQNILPTNHIPTLRSTRFRNWTGFRNWCSFLGIPTLSCSVPDWINPEFSKFQLCAEHCYSFSIVVVSTKCYLRNWRLELIGLFALRLDNFRTRRVHLKYIKRRVNTVWHTAVKTGTQILYAKTTKYNPCDAWNSPTARSSSCLHPFIMNCDLKISQQIHDIR